MQEKIIKLSKDLISIPSIKSEVKELKRVLEIAKKELSGFSYKEYESNGVPSLLYYNTKTLPKKFKFILNAHLDVVPGKPEQYSPKISGNKLIGRGALDMKAAAAVEILVFKELSKNISYPIGLQIVTDEEVGGQNGTGYQIKKGITADFVIAGEYTNLDINNSAKGPLWLKITAKGKSAHSAFLWQGDNAIQKMILFINKINQMYPIPKKEAWITTMNLTKIETSNVTFNKVPDTCSASFDIRRIPEDVDKVLKRIKSIIPNDFDLEILENEPAQFANKNDTYLTKLEKSIHKITNNKVNYIGFNGASDARFYTDRGIPAICFGPNGEGIHIDNEWVDIKSLDTYYTILKDFILSLEK
jgi:succinyl-diaminopimelate desuccinylase